MVSASSMTANVDTFGLVVVTDRSEWTPAMADMMVVFEGHFRAIRRALQHVDKAWLQILDQHDTQHSTPC